MNGVDFAGSSRWGTSDFTRVHPETGGWAAMYERSELPQVRQFKPYCLPESLDDLVGPSEGALVLPLYLHWAKQEGVTVDLGVLGHEVGGGVGVAEGENLRA